MQERWWQPEGGLQARPPPAPSHRWWRTWPGTARRWTHTQPSTAAPERRRCQSGSEWWGWWQWASTWTGLETETDEIFWSGSQSVRTWMFCSRLDLLHLKTFQFWSGTGCFWPIVTLKKIVSHQSLTHHSLLSEPYRKGGKTPEGRWQT